MAYAALRLPTQLIAVDAIDDTASSRLEIRAEVTLAPHGILVAAFAVSFACEEWQIKRDPRPLPRYVRFTGTARQLAEASATQVADSLDALAVSLLRHQTLTYLPVSKIHPPTWKES